MQSKEKIRAVVSDTNLLSIDDILLRHVQIPVNGYMFVEGSVREYLVKDNDGKSTAFFTEGDTFSPSVSAENDIPSEHYWEYVEDCAVTISNKRPTIHKNTLMHCKF